MRKIAKRLFTSLYNTVGFINYILATILAYTTPYFITYLISNSLSRLWHMSGHNVLVIKRNISKVTGLSIDDPKTDYLSKRIFMEFGKNTVDFLKNGIIPLKNFKKMIDIEGTENLSKSLEKGKGVVIFSAHIGNSEWGAARVGTEGFRLWGVGLYRNNKLLDNYFERNRKTKNINTLYANKIIGVFRLLKNNCIVAVPSDWDPFNTAKVYDFFGHKARIPSGALQIAITSGADLIPSFIHRDGKYHHKLMILPPIEIERNGPKEELVEKNMKKVIEVLEKFIKENISQWVLFHNIWVESDGT